MKETRAFFSGYQVVLPAIERRNRPLFIQQRNILCFRGFWQRFQECINIRQVLIRNYFGGVRRHLAAWMAHVFLDERKRQRVGPEPRANSALRRAAVAFVTTVLDETFFASVGAARRSMFRLLRNGRRFRLRRGAGAHKYQRCKGDRHNGGNRN